MTSEGCVEADQNRRGIQHREGNKNVKCSKRKQKASMIQRMKEWNS